MSETRNDTQTRFDKNLWGMIFIISGAGVVSAFQVGKAPMALSAVQAEMGVSLGVVSWLISAFAVIGAIAGAPIGLAVDRLGAKHLVIAGLLFQSLGSALGSMADDMAVLMLSRILEGLGFVSVLVSAPALIFASAPPNIRDRAISVWATIMPVGMTVVMLSSPLFVYLEWRGFWILNAALLFGYALFFAAFVPEQRTENKDNLSIIRQLTLVTSARWPWLLAMLFAIFAAAFFSVFGFLPSLLTERFGLSQNLANTIAALAIATSGIGNLASGMLLASGHKPASFMTGGLMVMSVSAFGILSLDIGWQATAGFAIAFAFASGVIPVVLMSHVPILAPRADLAGATMGITIQGNNVGMLAGPVSAGFIATSFGWTAVATMLVLALLLAVSLARFTFVSGPKPPIKTNPGP